MRTVMVASSPMDLWRELPKGRTWFASRALGAGLLIATGAIHLDLYLTGYRTIPTIGWLFLLQVITAFVLGAIVLVSGARLISASAAGFALATLGGYLLSLRVGLFGFREVRTRAGIVAGVIDVLAFTALAEVTLRPVAAHHSGLEGGSRQRVPALQAAIAAGRWVAAGCAVLAAVLLGLSISAAAPVSTSPGPGRTLLKAANIHGTAVLTNARGYTLYWFARDTADRSTCYGTCALYWPPVRGVPTAGRGVIGKLGTIRRAGGETQATYDGRPLYGYVGDSAPGQANGNDLNLNGGSWHEVTIVAGS